MDDIGSKLKNLEDLEAARAKEAWEKHVVKTNQFVKFYKNVLNILMSLQRAVQEKLDQVENNINLLNDWLEKAERKIAGQENLSEERENLKKQLTNMKVNI